MVARTISTAPIRSQALPLAQAGLSVVDVPVTPPGKMNGKLENFARRHLIRQTWWLSQNPKYRSTLPTFRHL